MIALPWIDTEKLHFNYISSYGFPLFYKTSVKSTYNLSFFFQYYRKNSLMLDKIVLDLSLYYE